MKTIIIPGVEEVSQFTCDICGQPAVCNLKFIFGYGSDHDLEYLDGDFCNKHGNILREKIIDATSLQPKEYNI